MSAFEGQSLPLCEIWVDGSAVECLHPVRLGAGWVCVFNGKSRGRSHVISDAPPNKSAALFAELKAATFALAEAPVEGPIKLYSDRREIIDCVNEKAVPRQIENSQPEMVPLFQELLALLEGLKVQAYRSRGSNPQSKTCLKKLSPHFSMMAHDAAHTLAAQASGSRKALDYPVLKKFLLSLE